MLQMRNDLSTLMSLGLLLGVVIGSCSGCVKAIGRTYSTPGEQELRAVVVSVVRTDGQRMTGSGVAVSSTEVLTAFHVIDRAAKVELTAVGGIVLSARIVASDFNSDVARLQITAGRIIVPPATVARGFFGDQVCLVPAEPERRRSCGQVSRWGSGPHGVWHDALTLPGNSGSGVYDSRGRLVGIVTQRRGTLDHPEGGIVTPLAPRKWLVGEGAQ